MQSASRGSFKRAWNISCHSVKFKTGVSVYMVMKPLSKRCLSLLRKIMMRCEAVSK